MIADGVFHAEQLIFRDEDAVQSLGEKHDRILLIYEEAVYDATPFVDKHPGGSSILEDYSGYDISEIFHDAKAHKHSKAALAQLQQFLIGHINDEEFQAKTQYLINYGDFQIDQSKPLLTQIEKLTAVQYQKLRISEAKQVYIPRLKEDDVKKSIQLQETPALEQSLWYRRQLLSEVELILSLFCLVFVLSFTAQFTWIHVVAALFSLVIEYRWLITLYVFSSRSGQYRYYQNTFPVKLYVTKYWCIGELSILLFIGVPYIQMYTVVQLFIMGIKNHRIMRMQDQQYLMSLSKS